MIQRAIAHDHDVPQKTYSMRKHRAKSNEKRP